MSEKKIQPADDSRSAPADGSGVPAVPTTDQPEPKKPQPHPDPTRYGDWEKNGRCIDF